MSTAIAGNEVAITVESMFSMNRAAATISGMIRCLSIVQIKIRQMHGSAPARASARGVGTRPGLGHLGGAHCPRPFPRSRHLYRFANQIFGHFRPKEPRKHNLLGQSTRNPEITVLSTLANPSDGV